MEREDWADASFTQPTSESDTDPLSTDQLLETMRSLVREVHGATVGRTVAVQAVALVHIFHTFDLLVSAGHKIPDAWRR